MESKTAAWKRTLQLFLPTDKDGGGYGKLIKEKPNEIFFCFLFTFASGIGQTFLLSLFQPHWRDYLGINAATMGSLYGGATLLSAALLPFLGRWLDRSGPHRSTLAVCIGLTLAAVLGGWVLNIWTLFIALFTLRFFGQGFSTNLGITTAARWFDRNRAKAVSFTSLGFPLSEMILPTLVTLLILGIGWRLTWVILAAGALLLVFPLAKWLLRHYPKGRGWTRHLEETDTTAVPQERGPLLRDIRFYAMLAISFPAPFLGTGVLFFQALIAEEKGWSAAIFPSGFVVFAIARALFSLTAGSWADRLGSLRLLPLPTSLLAVGLVALIPDHPAWAYLFFAMLGISFATMGGIMTTAWADIFGSERIGLIKGFASSFGVFCTAIAPVIFGFLFEAHIPLGTIFLTSAIGVLLISWPVSLWIIRHQRKQKLLP